MTKWVNIGDVFGAGGGTADPETIRDTVGTALVAGTNMVVTVNDAGNTITIGTNATVNSSDATLLARGNHTGTQLASTISNFSEAVDDRVAALVVAGTGITATYDDTAGTLTLAATGGGGGGLDVEAAVDAIAAALVGSAPISVVYNDVAGTITISTSATVNATDAQLRDRSTHTGTMSADSLTDGTTKKAMTAAERTKLAGILATANVSEVNGYTGDVTLDASDVQAVPAATRNIANGFAGLDASGKILPAQQLHPIATGPDTDTPPNAVTAGAGALLFQYNAAGTI